MEELGAQLEVENQEQESTVEEIRDSGLRSLELQYQVKWKGFPNKESSWEPVAHFSKSMEFVEEFHQSNPTKPSQATLGRALKEAAKKEARKKARAEAAREAQKARKRKAEEALVGWPKRHSERLQSKIGSESQ